MRNCIYPFLVVFMLQSSGVVPVFLSGGMPGTSVYAAVCSAAEHAAAKKNNNRNGDGPREERTLCSFKYIIYFFWYACCALLFAVVIVMDLSTGCGQHYTKDFYGWCKENTASLDRLFRRIGCG